MPLDVSCLLDRPQQPIPTRRVHVGRDQRLALLEIADGDGLWIGPDTSHAEVERLATQLLSCTGPGSYIPPLVHKLCVAYLAARNVERVA